MLLKFCLKLRNLILLFTIFSQEKTHKLSGRIWEQNHTNLMRKILGIFMKLEFLPVILFEFQWYYHRCGSSKCISCPQALLWQVKFILVVCQVKFLPRPRIEWLDLALTCHFLASVVIKRISLGLRP